MSTLVYRGFDQAALDQAYDNRRACKNLAAIKADWDARSLAVYARSRCERDLAYGPGARQRLDYFYAGDSKRPTLLYIHGGYWQWNDKEPHAFIAEGPLARGFNVALVEYTLAPAITMDGIVAEIRASIEWLLPRLGREFGAADTLVVSGHSAGGHLTAMAMELPGVTAALAISGLYDLEPIRLSYLNEAVRLSPEDARRNSPILRAPRPVPAIVTVGGDELPELQRQSGEYAAYLRGRGHAVQEIVTPGDDHFAILERLARADGALLAAVARLTGDAA
jgi:arylformamidase